MAAARPQLDEAIGLLSAVVQAGPAALVAGLPSPTGGSSGPAVELFDVVEQARRLAAVVAVDAIAQIDACRLFYDHGHANARVMFAHVAGVSGAESHRLDKIRRMIAAAEQIDGEWRNGRLSVDKAALLAFAYANPRTRNRFLIDQKWFIKRARRFGFKRLRKIVARWIEVHDHDGPKPAADPTFERRKASLSQDHFSMAWRLEADLGSLQGSMFNETLRDYLHAEFLKDWAAAEQLHGADTNLSLLARTHEQRMADALCQLAADARNSDKPSAPVTRVHNIVWNAETYEELLRRWVDAPARMLDPDTYNICDLDGHPLVAATAFADSLVSSLRRVVQNAAGVTIDMAQNARLFTGLARLGVKLTTTECYWPGCHVPTSQCHLDHLKPAARGGCTTQHNGLPACPRHNYLKERGYTVTRDPNGQLTITTPLGDTITCEPR